MSWFERTREHHQQNNKGTPSFVLWPDPPKYQMKSDRLDLPTSHRDKVQSTVTSLLSMTWCEPLILRRGHIWSIRPDIIFWGKMLTFPSKVKARLFLQANEAQVSEAWLLATCVTELLRQWKTWTTTSNKTREYEATEQHHGRTR